MTVPAPVPVLAPEPALFRRLAIFVLIGPPLGAIALLLLGPLIIFGEFNYSKVYTDLALSAVIVLLIPAYYLGLVPAVLVGALDWALDKRHIGPVWRAAACAAAGAALSLVPLAAGFAMGFLFGFLPLSICIAGIVAGGGCSGLTSWLWRGR